MKTYLWRAFFASLLLCLSASQNSTAQTRDGEFQAIVGGGLGLHTPVRFDLDMAGEYFWNDTYSLGLDFDIFVRGSTAFDVIPFARYHFDLKKWPRFSPYVGAGAGVLTNTAGGGWFDLMLPEAGFLYEFNPHFSFGPNVSLHTLAGSTTTWDLQLLAQAAYRF